ncbi:MAG: polysaccharide biosynthesis C-terminal domain-containing protein [Vicinamibacterales bacterium]
MSGKAAADLAGKLVTFGVTIAAARALPAETFGVVALATTWGWLAGVATDAGWSMYLAREVARRPSMARSLARQVVWRRGRAALGAGLLTTLGGVALLDPAVAAGFALVAWSQLAAAVLETSMHVFRGLERTDIEARLHAAQRVAAGVLAAGALVARPSLSGLGVALLLPPLAAIVAARRETQRLTEGSGASAEAPWLDLAALRTLVWPLGLATIVSAVYFRCDVFFVEHWHGAAAVGAYNAAFRLVDAIRLFPAAVLAVAFPSMVRARDGATIRRVALPLTAVGLAAGIATSLTAPFVMHLAYGAKFDGAITSLRWLGLAVPLFFLNYALTHQVIGWDGQRAFLRVTIGALAVNLAANLALVPARGGDGAAIATAITEVAVTAGCLMALARRTAGEPTGVVAPEPVA